MNTYEFEGRKVLFNRAFKDKAFDKFELCMALDFDKLKTPEQYLGFLEMVAALFAQEAQDFDLARESEIETAGLAPVEDARSLEDAAKMAAVRG